MFLGNEIMGSRMMVIIMKQGKKISMLLLSTVVLCLYFEDHRKSAYPDLELKCELSSGRPLCCCDLRLGRRRRHRRHQRQTDVLHREERDP